MPLAPLQIITLLEKAATVGMAILKSKRDRPKRETISRFSRIFAAQGLQRSQIIRIVPAMAHVSAGDVLNDDRLLCSLNNDVLDCVVAKFGVQRDWLDLADDHIYGSFAVYKNLRKFLDLLIELKSRHACVEMHAVKGVGNRLETWGGLESIAVFLREEVDRLDEAGAVWRDFAICDQWNWTHPPARIELKAMALMAWQFRITIDSHVVKQTRIDDFLKGKLLCGELIRDSSIHAWHLDDYIFTSSESKCATDEQEALVVRQHLEDLGLMMPLLAATGCKSLNVPIDSKKQICKVDGKNMI